MYHHCAKRRRAEYKEQIVDSVSRPVDQECTSSIDGSEQETRARKRQDYLGFSSHRLRARAATSRRDSRLLLRTALTTSNLKTDHPAWFTSTIAFQPEALPALELTAMPQQVANGMLEDHFRVVSRTPAHRERQRLNFLLRCVQKRLNGLLRQQDPFR